MSRPKALFRGCTIGAVCGNLLQSCGLIGTHAKGKCLKDVRETTLRADPLGPLRGPHGGNEDKKDVKIGSVSERRNNLVSERGHIRHSERYQAPWGMYSSRKETGRLSGCVDW